VQLAKRKVKTWVLDRNANMLQFAQQKAAAAGVALTAMQGDMTSFEVQVCCSITQCNTPPLGGLQATSQHCE
jgi:hypothetical protein